MSRRIKTPWGDARDCAHFTGPNVPGRVVGPLVDVELRSTAVAGRERARARRAEGYASASYERDIKAGNAILTVFVVVTREKVAP